MYRNVRWLGDGDTGNREEIETFSFLQRERGEDIEWSKHYPWLPSMVDKPLFKQSLSLSKRLAGFSLFLSPCGQRSLFFLLGRWRVLWRSFELLLLEESWILLNIVICFLGFLPILVEREMTVSFALSIFSLNCWLFVFYVYLVWVIFIVCCLVAEKVVEEKENMPFWFLRTKNSIYNLCRLC